MCGDRESGRALGGWWACGDRESGRALGGWWVCGDRESGWALGGWWVCGDRESVGGTLGGRLATICSSYEYNYHDYHRIIFDALIST